MQYVWQHRLWLPGDMRTVAGDPVEVLDPGLLNNSAGPDFFNAKIKIGQHLWAGNVEIHVRASDWHRHGHDGDTAYDNVILHVVERDDTRITAPDGKEIPQIVMACAANFAKDYGELVNRPGSDLACCREIANIPAIYISDWLSALSLERLYSKSDRVAALYRRLNCDWNQTVYVTLARALGFGTNSDAFERLAIGMPLMPLLHHQDDITVLEAALFGQAGFLKGLSLDDHYFGKLIAQYDFMRVKYRLPEMQSLGWRISGRPHNFPYRRIAMLAAFVAQGFSIGRKIFGIENLEQARKLFDVQLQGFWANHYTFDSPAQAISTTIGKSSVDILVINVVVPLLHAYGITYGNSKMIDLATDILQQMKPEVNYITCKFTDIGIPCPDALTSQALNHLYREYCTTRKCLYCRIGHRLLAAKAIRR